MPRQCAWAQQKRQQSLAPYADLVALPAAYGSTTALVICTRRHTPSRPIRFSMGEAAIGGIADRGNRRVSSPADPRPFALINQRGRLRGSSKPSFESIPPAVPQGAVAELYRSDAQN